MNNRISLCFAAAILISGHALLASASEPMPVAAETGKLSLAMPLRWESADALIKPVSDETRDIVSVKDPTIGPARYYRAWIFDRLDGQWMPVQDATTWKKPFAGANNVTFPQGVTPWTRDISQGELIRDGCDETLTVDPNNLQFLYQGRDPAIEARYDQSPYRLALLQSERSSDQEG